MMITKIRIRPIAMIIGVLSGCFFVPRLPFVYAGFLPEREPDFFAGLRACGSSASGCVCS